MPLQVLPVADEPLAPPPSAECRVYERLSCELPTACQPASAHEMKWDATIRDISLSGVRLSLRRRFEPGSGLTIELPEADGQEKYVVFVKVVHCRREDDGSWALGCRFLSELSEDELGRLLAQQNVVPAVRLRVETPSGRPLHLRVKRLRFSESWPLQPGRTVALRGTTPDGRPWQHRFAVVACEEQQAGWALHVRLLDAVDLHATFGPK